MPTCPKCNHTFETSRKKKDPAIIYDTSMGKFVCLNGRLQYWQEQYPTVHIEQEIRKAETWIRANYEQRKKSDYERFLVNWLNKASDKANEKAYALQSGAKEELICALKDERNRSLPTDITSAAKELFFSYKKPWGLLQKEAREGGAL